MKVGESKGKTRTFELPSRSQLDPHVSFTTAGDRSLVLDAVFSGPRGRPTGVLGTTGFELDDQHPVGRPAPNVLRLALRWPPKVEHAHLVIGSTGEPLDLVKFIVRGGEGRPLAVLTSADRAGRRTYLPGSPDWEQVTNTLDPAGYLDSVDRELEVLARDKDERFAGRKFFADLDREANPFLLLGMASLGRIHREDADQRRLAIEAIANELRVRVRLRCRGLNESKKTCPSLQDRLFEHLGGRCRSVSELLLDLIDRHFGKDLRAFERAFTQFANGDLRMELPSLVITAQPSSANFFLFGEFALMARDFGIEPDRWWSLANVMVRSQRIFARAYAPPSLDGADFFSYSGQDYAKKGKPYSDEEARRLEDEFRGADLVFEAGKNAALSMPGLLK